MAAVSRAVVGHHPLDADPEASEPGERAFEKRYRALFALVGQHPRCTPAARRHRYRRGRIPSRHRAGGRGDRR